VRAGLQSISYGQIEAARALGLSYVQMLRLVLLPQAFRIIVPPLGTNFIALIKNTSITSAITVTDIIYQSEYIEGRTFSPDIFLFAGLLYLILTVPMSGLVNVAEERLRLRRR
jgi:putative glutamine transport system permease protein